VQLGEQPCTPGDLAAHGRDRDFSKQGLAIRLVQHQRFYFQPGCAWIILHNSSTLNMVDWRALSSACSRNSFDLALASRRIPKGNQGANSSRTIRLKPVLFLHWETALRACKGLVRRLVGGASRRVTIEASGCPDIPGAAFKPAPLPQVEDRQCPVHRGVDKPIQIASRKNVVQPIPGRRCLGTLIHKSILMLSPRDHWCVLGIERRKAECDDYV
jgi:hypothetical protein